MILVIDNYDSFTWNIVSYLRVLGVSVEVVRNDSISVGDALALRPSAVVISPGPCRPEDAGISLHLVAACVARPVPVLGICLGHQVIAQHFGAVIERGGMMHGKIVPMHHDDTGLFTDLPSPFSVARYHSLRAANVARPLVANAWSEDGTIMGLRHETLPIHSVQYHPESIGSDYGYAVLSRFLAIGGIAHDHQKTSTLGPRAR